AAVHLGALARAAIPWTPAPPPEDTGGSERTATILGWVLVVPAVIPFILYVLGYRELGYIADLLVPGAFLLIAAGKNNVKTLLCGSGIIAIYCGFHFFDRNLVHAAAVLIPALW